LNNIVILKSGLEVT